MFLYTKEQQAMLAGLQVMLQDFFGNADPGHGFDHAERVAARSKHIAGQEQARSVWLCELAGLLHDVGRVPEHLGKAQGRAHHELSYELLQEWFRTDQIFLTLTTEEKLELLYTVRYHGNDEANQYDTAWILRDADKLDMLGQVGVDRTIASHPGDLDAQNFSLRLRFQAAYYIHTATAKKIIEDEKLFEPIIRYQREILRQKIKPVSL